MKLLVDVWLILQSKLLCIIRFHVTTELFNEWNIPFACHFSLFQTTTNPPTQYSPLVSIIRPWPRFNQITILLYNNLFRQILPDIDGHKIHNYWMNEKKLEKIDSLTFETGIPSLGVCLVISLWPIMLLTKSGTFAGSLVRWTPPWNTTKYQHEHPGWYLAVFFRMVVVLRRLRN